MTPTMSQLSFRVILVNQEETNDLRKDRLKAVVKSAIESCELTDVSINFSQVKKSEDEDYPEIEGLILDVRAKCKKTNYYGKAQLYADFLSNWKRQCSSLPCSYIEFYANDSFVKCKTSHHKIEYKSLAFGVLPHNGNFHQFASLIPSVDKVVHFYHDTRNVTIEYKCFQANFSYDNIRNIFVAIDSYPCNVYFDLFNPPLVFRIGGRNEMRYRNLDFSQVSLVRDIFGFNLNSRKSRTFINGPGEIDVDVLGRANVICLTIANQTAVNEIISRIHYHCSEKPVYYSHIRGEAKITPPDPIIEDMHFGCTYLITAIIKRNFVLMSQTPDIGRSLRELLSLSLENPEALEKALTSVLVALDSGKILNFWQAIADQYRYYKINRNEINFRDYIVPSKCCLIRRITLTPTRQLFWPKEIMFSNRVLRNFDSEYSIRVAFREDNMFRLSGNAPYADSGVLESCIKNPMRNGIKIGRRRYEFLAWSNSQIRDHGVWMYARDERGKTAENVRQWMGDFSHIHNVPKYMARMGQCFSQTEDALTVPLNPSNVIVEKDIEGGWDRVNNKPYCFSDGVGRISTDLAAKVRKALGHDKLCSAFQIRYGGCKGMLVVDPTLHKAQIVFRESMKKFDCPNSTSLEIAKTSAPIPLQLNRPFITILNSLGVRHRMFLRLQEDMLKTLTDMLFVESVAANFLQSKTPTNLYNFEDLSKSGIHLTTEPYFKSLLLALHRHHINNIKMRANIAVDPSKGRNMMGVLDETNSLRYGEVFVQYSKDISYGETTKDTEVKTGEVLVTKNPCMHPGDVRKFKAVNAPALRHIVDCIVFPQCGPRPHPNEMAGSDLDGDEYTVLWDPELIFHSWNKPAADFPAIHSPDVPNVTVEHMISFLQDYIKGDQVGVIANAHLAQAHNIDRADDLERSRQGIFSEVCERIANKFSIAVDFAKNGCPQKLDKEDRPAHYPDFMEKMDREAFKSEMALGKMYRVCKDFESENEITSIHYENVEPDPDLVFNGWEKYKDNAIAARNKYNALFRSVLRNYGIQHEAEALSGAFTHLHCRFQERKDRNEIEKVIIGCIKKLYKCMFEEFMEEFANSGDVSSTDQKILQKASAWYVVTYSEPGVKFLSFPWTVAKYLVNIKLRKKGDNPLPFSPAIMNLDQKILEFESENLLPNYVETRIWNDYDILCDSRLLRRALRALMLWAQEEEIVERPGYHQGLLFMDVFVRLFFHVADITGYVVLRRKRETTTPRKQYSAAHFCLEFLKFCSTLRFYNKNDIKDVVPFPVYKYSQLAKRAIISYHTFALSGTLQTFKKDRRIEGEDIIMKPFQIESKLFLSTPIKQAELSNAENVLMKYSKVNVLNLRELRQTKKVQVSAEGSEKALKELKSILRKKHVILRQLFATGIMPETN